MKMKLVEKNDSVGSISSRSFIRMLRKRDKAATANPVNINETRSA